MPVAVKIAAQRALRKPRRVPRPHRLPFLLDAHGAVFHRDALGRAVAVEVARNLQILPAREERTVADKAAHGRAHAQEQRRRAENSAAARGIIVSACHAPSAAKPLTHHGRSISDASAKCM